MPAGTRNSKGKNWRWRGGTVSNMLSMGMRRNMEDAVNFLNNDIVLKFPGGGPSGTRSGGSGGAHSKAGGIPFVQTGRLRGAMNWEVKGTGFRIIGRVGTGIGSAESAGYALWLEFGTKDMTERPFLRPGLKRNKRRVNKEMGKDVF